MDPASTNPFLELPSPTPLPPMEAPAVPQSILQMLATAKSCGELALLVGRYNPLAGTAIGAACAAYELGLFPDPLAIWQQILQTDPSLLTRTLTEIQQAASSSSPPLDPLGDAPLMAPAILDQSDEAKSHCSVCSQKVPDQKLIPLLKIPEGMTVEEL